MTSKHLASAASAHRQQNAWNNKSNNSVQVTRGNAQCLQNTGTSATGVRQHGLRTMSRIQRQFRRMILELKDKSIQLVQNKECMYQKPSSIPHMSTWLCYIVFLLVYVCLRMTNLESQEFALLMTFCVIVYLL